MATKKKEDESTKSQTFLQKYWKLLIAIGVLIALFIIMIVVMYRRFVSSTPTVLSSPVPLPLPNSPVRSLPLAPSKPVPSSPVPYMSPMVPMAPVVQGAPVAPPSLPSLPSQPPVSSMPQVDVAAPNPGQAPENPAPTAVKIGGKKRGPKSGLSTGIKKALKIIEDIKKESKKAVKKGAKKMAGGCGCVDMGGL